MFKRQQRNSFHTGELSYSPTIGETQIANANFELISLNARGIRDFQKRQAIFSWIKKQNADIAFLQETYSTPEIVDEWKFQWHGNIYYSHGTNHSKGVLILVSDKLQFELRSVSQDSDDRYVLIDVLIQGSPFLLLNIYSPNKTSKSNVECVKVTHCRLTFLLLRFRFLILQYVKVKKLWVSK